jgi:hypothetical protein
MFTVRQRLGRLFSGVRCLPCSIVKSVADKTRICWGFPPGECIVDYLLVVCKSRVWEGVVLDGYCARHDRAKALAWTVMEGYVTYVSMQQIRVLVSEGPPYGVSKGPPCMGYPGHVGVGTH